MKFALRLYPYTAPLVLAPLAFYLWWSTYQQQWLPTLVAWLVPILWAYIVPGVGTNVCKVWEFDTRLKLGRFRPQHGFVFGSATAMLAWLVHGAPAHSAADVLRYGLVLCGVLGFVNYLYEVKALQAGVLKVYNQPWADGRGAEAIAYDYAPWMFGGFGAAYGVCIGAAEWGMQSGVLHDTPWHTAAVLVLALAACIGVPVLGFMQASRRRHGHAGTRPVFAQGEPK